VSVVRIDLEPHCTDASALGGAGAGSRETKGGVPSSVTRMERAIPFAELEALLARMEEHQKGKVLELARRLHPGLTLEDIQNPHDFAELADVDWHYEDGILTGIQSVVSAVRAVARSGSVATQGGRGDG
jgi:hypothetical protein